MKRISCLAFVAFASWTQAGQPVERFRSANHMTFCHGSLDTRYGNADANTHIVMQVFILGTQTFDSPANQAEANVPKTAGSLNFAIKLSDFDPTLPPDTITFDGSDLGNDLMRHTCDSVLPGPYHQAGTINGTSYDLTLRNVRVTGILNSQGSNSVTLPFVNPVLNEACDVQFDDPAGSSNSITIVPQQVSGWVVSPIFTVSSMRVDITGIQHAGQVPAHVIAPASFAVQLGRLSGGDLTSLAMPDGAALQVCKFIVPNQQVPPVIVEVVSPPVSVPAYLSFATVSRMSVTGIFQQILGMYDFSGTGYTSGDTRTDPSTTNYDYRVLNGTSVSRYVDGSGALKARYQFRQNGPAASLSWCTDQDFAVWYVTP